MYLLSMGVVHLDTVQRPTATHSDRCLEAFHCSSAVSGQLNRVHLNVTHWVLRRTGSTGRTKAIERVDWLITAKLQIICMMLIRSEIELLRVKCWEH